MKIKLSQYNFPEFKNLNFLYRNKLEYNSFYKSLFENTHYSEIVEEVYYKISKHNVICGIIKILKPNDCVIGINGYLNIEEFDKQFKVSLIKREIKLTYPTIEEASLLNVKTTEVVVIEINKIYDINNNVIRYEEKIMKPNYIVYEDNYINYK